MPLIFFITGYRNVDENQKEQLRNINYRSGAGGVQGGISYTSRRKFVVSHSDERARAVTEFSKK